MEPSDCRIRTAASPLLVAVAFGMLGLHVLLDEEDHREDDVPDGAPLLPLRFAAPPSP